MAEEEKIDWVQETYDSFIANAEGLDPTDPVAAVGAYFEKNATEELKAKCKEEGKDAKGCWKFIEAVARKALNGSSGHIDPSVIYAIAMHWFQDVPKDWNKTANHELPPAPAKKPKPEKKPAAAKKPKKPKSEQGFFFDLMEEQR